MADITVKYKNNIITEMSSEGTKTLKTSGKYCEDDISISYKPPSTGDSTEVRYKTYELTLTKASGWVLLTTLDDEVVSHINDETLVVTLRCISPYVYEKYVMSSCTLSNIPIGTVGNYPAYGNTQYTNTETAMANGYCFYPPNKSDTSTSLGGGGMFRISGNKYYFRPSGYYTRAGTYRLTFTW